VDRVTQKGLRTGVRSYLSIPPPTMRASIVGHCGVQDIETNMISRLHKAILLQRQAAYDAAVKACEEYIKPIGPPLRKLPYPRKLFSTPRSRGKIMRGGSSLISYRPGPLIIVRENKDWTMMEKHLLWVRVFDKYDRVIFNHADPCTMHTSQMIHLCTKLINYLNLISQTNEMEVQEALGTLEGTITAQLTPPLNEKTQYHSWNLQGTNICHDVGAIAIIRQDADDTFKGQLIDDFMRVTFQLQ